MKRPKEMNFSPEVIRKVKERSNNRCERCGVDLDEKGGEIHHIVPILYGGINNIDNCSLLCSNCHKVAPNIKDKRDIFMYKHYFLRFSSFKEAAKFYRVDNRLDVYLKFALEMAKTSEGKKEIIRIKQSMSNKD